MTQTRFHVPPTSLDSTRFLLVSVKSAAAPDCTGPPQGASAKTSRVTSPVVVFSLSPFNTHKIKLFVFKSSFQAGRAAKTASTLASTLASSQSAGNLR